MMIESRRLKAGVATLLYFCLLVSPVLRAETARLQVSTSPSSLHIQSTLDDTHLRDPTGYEAGTVHDYFMDRIVVTNGSSRTVSGFHLEINGGSPLAPGRVKVSNSAELFAVFNHWSGAIHHAPTHHGFANHAASLVNFIGHGLCGHNTNALINLLAGAGLSYRVVPVNGHGVAEYLVDGRYRVIDGDQDAVFFGWNNINLAGYADIRHDPLLAIRTRMYGLSQPYDLESSWINASVFEYVRETGNADMALVPASPRWERQGWDLLPGEQLEYRFREPPPGAEPDIGTVVLTLDTPARLNKEGVLVVGTPLPVYRIEFNGQLVAVPGLAENLAVEVKMKAAATDRVRVFMQGSVRQFPQLRRGNNRLQLAGVNKRTVLDVEVHYHASNRVLPRAEVNADATGLRISTAVTAPDGLWWQVSHDESFEVIAPNLNQVQGYQSVVDWHPLTMSFLNPGQRYFARARVRADGLWGDWSDMVAFSASKPARPQGVSYELRDGNVVLTWGGAAALSPEKTEDVDVTWLVFGSNRMDFVPAVYAQREILFSEDKQVSRTGPNDNLLGKVSRTHFVDDAPKAFYRIIASEGERLSVPSDLVHVSELRRQATVLQMRWKKEQLGPDELDYRDVYIASEHLLSNSNQ